LYNIGGYLRIDGPVDPVIFEQAVRQVVRENDASRIILHEGDPAPMQEFREDVQFDVPFLDFSDEDNAMQKAVEWVQQELVKPFQLYGALLFRYALVKVSDNCYCYLNKLHHLIVDGWAISLVVNRIAEAYNALLAGEEHSMPKPSYLDFILDEQEHFQSERFERSRRYWLDKYRELPEPLIPRRYAAQFQEQTIPSRTSYLWVERELYDKLTDFATSHKATTFHVILACTPQ